MRFKISRRGFLFAAAMSGQAAGFRKARAQDGPLILKCASNAPEQTPTIIRLREAFKNVKEETRGRVDVQLFPASQLGSDTDMFLQVRAGAIDMMLHSGTNMSTLAPKASVASVAFAFRDYGTVWAAMDGELGALIRHEADAIGVTCLPRAFDVGFRQITNSLRPVETPQDLRGLKLRVPQSDAHLSMFRALGAAPVAKSFGEVYQSLQTKLLDGQENSLAVVQLVRFYEVQKYVAMTNHSWDYQWMVTNSNKWRALPDNFRTVLEAQITRAALLQREDWAGISASAEETLKQKGLSFTAPDANLFKQTLAKAGYYSEWQKRYGAEVWSTLEKYSGRLG